MNEGPWDHTKDGDELEKPMNSKNDEHRGPDPLVRSIPDDIGDTSVWARIMQSNRGSSHLTILDNASDDAKLGATEIQLPAPETPKRPVSYSLSMQRNENSGSPNLLAQMISGISHLLGDLHRSLDKEEVGLEDKVSDHPEDMTESPSKGGEGQYGRDK